MKRFSFPHHYTENTKWLLLNLDTDLVVYTGIAVERILDCESELNLISNPKMKSKEKCSTKLIPTARWNSDLDEDIKEQTNYKQQAKKRKGKIPSINLTVKKSIFLIK